MIYIREMMLTPTQARALVSMGFVLTLVKLFCREWDLYVVGVKP